MIPLNVSGPFHSAMLATAGKELGKVLEGVTLHELKIPYVTNVTAEYVEDPAETKALLENRFLLPCAGSRVWKYDPSGSRYIY